MADTRVPYIVTTGGLAHHYVLLTPEDAERWHGGRADLPGTPGPDGEVTLTIDDFEYPTDGSPVVYPTSLDNETGTSFDNCSGLVTFSNGTSDPELTEDDITWEQHDLGGTGSGWEVHDLHNVDDHTLQAAYGPFPVPVGLAGEADCRFTASGDLGNIAGRSNIIAGDGSTILADTHYAVTPAGAARAKTAKK